MTRNGNVERNRRDLLTAVKAVDESGELWPLAQVKQIHSSIVHRVNEAAKEPIAGDGNDHQCARVAAGDQDRRLQCRCCWSTRSAAWWVRFTQGGAERLRASWRRVWARCAASSAACLATCARPSAHVCASAATPSAPKCAPEFDSQFTYADELFEEVFDSNAIHIRYPLLFLNKRAPGHGDLGPEIHLDLVGANRRAVAGCRPPRRKHQCDRRLHRVRHEAILLPPARVREDRQNDGGGRDQGPSFSASG